MIFQTILIILAVLLCLKCVRYYLYSFAFPFLYDRPCLSYYLGIKYVDDTTFVPKRENTQIYLTGIFAKIFTWFTGMPIITALSTRQELLRLQGSFANDISMEDYLDKIVGEGMTLSDFENKLSKFILRETNRVFNVLSEGEEQLVYEQLESMRIILSGLTGGESKSLIAVIRGLKHIRKVVHVLREKTPAQRLLILIPHLSLIEGFSKMIVKRNGKSMEDLQMKDFFDYTSRFFVVIHNGSLTFINRSPDDKNTENNRAFGVTPGFLCPGSRYVAKFIKSILEFLKCLDIKVEGNAHISNNRFRVITNKDDIYLTFSKSDSRVYNSKNTLE